MPEVGGGRERLESREKMSTMRRAIAKRLVEVKNETAMLTTFNEVDLTEVKKLRASYKEKFKRDTWRRTGIYVFLHQGCYHGVDGISWVNAQIDGKEIIYHNYADIGIAVSTPRGLVVPVIRNGRT